jgi:hypothetical protein
MPPALEWAWQQRQEEASELLHQVRLALAGCASAAGTPAAAAGEAAAAEVSTADGRQGSGTPAGAAPSEPQAEQQKQQLEALRLELSAVQDQCSSLQAEHKDLLAAHSSATAALGTVQQDAARLAQEVQAQQRCAQQDEWARLARPAAATQTEEGWAELQRQLCQVQEELSGAQARLAQQDGGLAMQLTEARAEVARLQVRPGWRVVPACRPPRRMVRAPPPAAAPSAQVMGRVSL